MSIIKIIGSIILLIGIGLLLKYTRAKFLKESRNETIKSISDKLEDNVFMRLQNDFKKIGLATFPEKLKILAFKEERKLLIYVSENEKNQLLKTYNFTGFSGKLGPKLKEGDRQIPEGIYEVEYLNPNSAFYLSIKVNYPNAFDKKVAQLENRTDIGSDIFIHGKNKSIGCIPVGDEAIEEIFILCSKAINKKIEIIIAPRDFRKNPALPQLDNVSWSSELYTDIKKGLEEIPI